MILETLKTWLVPLGALAAGGMAGWWLKTLRHQIDRAVLDELWTRKLRLASDDVQRAQDILALTSSENEGLRSRFQVAAQSLQSATGELTESRDALQKITRALKDREAVNEALGDNSRKLKRDLRDLETQKAQAQEALGQLEARAAELEASLTENEREGHKQLTEKENALARANRQCEGLQKKESQRVAELEQRSTKIGQLRTRLSELEGELSSEKTASGKRVDELQRECKALEERYASASQEEARIEELEGELVKKDVELEEAKQHAFVLEPLIEERDNSIATLKQEREELSLRIAELETVASELEDAHKAQHDLEQSSADSLQTHEKLKAELEAELADSHKQAETRRTRLETLEEQLRTLREAQKEQRKLSAAQTASLKSAKLEVERSQKKGQASLEKAQLRFEKAQARVEELKQRMAELKVDHREQLTMARQAQRTTAASKQAAGQSSGSSATKTTTKAKPKAVTRAATASSPKKNQGGSAAKPARSPKTKPSTKSSTKPRAAAAAERVIERRGKTVTVAAHKVVDELTQLRGLGPASQKALRKLGITSFRQIAELDADSIGELAPKLKLTPARIKKDLWVQSARKEHRAKYGEDL